VIVVVVVVFLAVVAVAGGTVVAVAAAAWSHCGDCHDEGMLLPHCDCGGSCGNVEMPVGDPSLCDDSYSYDYHPIDCEERTGCSL
jgi:hypothetical protein